MNSGKILFMSDSPTENLTYLNHTLGVTNMTKTKRLRMQMQLKNIGTIALKEYVIKGIVLMLGEEDDSRFFKIGREVALLKRELKIRGIKVTKMLSPIGPVIGFAYMLKPINLPAPPDTFAKADCVMVIPSITDLLNLPLPTDLPTHGYIGR